MGLAARNTEPDITTGDAGRVALTFFFNLMEHWGCSKEQPGRRVRSVRRKGADYCCSTENNYLSG